MKNKIQKISLILCLGIVSGCGIITKNYQKPKIATESASLFREYTNTDSSSIANIKWDEYFTDTDLKSLIKECLDKNYDLKNALLQVNIAENTLRQTKLSYFPTFNFAPTLTLNNQSRNALNFPSNVNIKLQTTNINLGLSAGWEIEVWGKLTAAKRSAQASYLQSDATKRALQTSLVATVADLYYTLLALDRQLEITEQTIEVRKKTLLTITALMDLGKLSSADLALAESNVYAAQATLPDLHRSIRELENALCLLLAKPSQSIKRGKLNIQTWEPQLMAGVPAQLLANRPDVQAAEYSYQRSWELTNVARASFYPTVTLTGNTGLSALTSHPLFDPLSIFSSLIGGLVTPIFRLGSLQTNYRNAKLVQEQSWNIFQQTLLKAGQEVSNALFAYQMVKQKQTDRQKQVQALQKAVDDRMKLLEFSNTNYTDVLTAEQGLLGAKISETTDKLQGFQAMITLYRSLGGGWK